MDDLAKGMGSDGSELCSVRLIILTHIMKSPVRLQTSPTYMAGTVSSVLKCRRASTL